MVDPDEAYVDETPRRPLIEFNNPWTACITGFLAFLSLGLGMSILTMGYGWRRLFALIDIFPGWAQMTIVLLTIIAHFGSLVGPTSMLIHGLARTGDDAAVLIRGRRFGGMRLGLFYFVCFVAPWLAYGIAFALMH